MRENEYVPDTRCTSLAMIERRSHEIMPICWVLKKLPTRRREEHECSLECLISPPPPLSFQRGEVAFYQAY